VSIHAFCGKQHYAFIPSDRKNLTKSDSVVSYEKTDKPLYQSSSFKNYAIKRGSEKIIEITGDTVFDNKINKSPFVYDGRNSFFILSNNKLLSFSGIKRITVDYLVVSGSCSKSLSDFKSVIDYKHLVIHPSLRKWMKEN
jgi:hypothetical protein